MEQPKGSEVKEKENLVCKLKKSIYGLEQAPRQWNLKLNSFMVSNGYKRTRANPMSISEDILNVGSLFHCYMLVTC